MKDSEKVLICNLLEGMNSWQQMNIAKNEWGQKREVMNGESNEEGDVNRMNV